MHAVNDIWENDMIDMPQAVTGDDINIILKQRRLASLIW